MRTTVLLPAMIVLLVSACASRHETYALLPSSDGNSGALSIRPRQGGEPLVLDKPYAAAEASGGRVARVDTDAKTISTQFGEALAAQPEPPVTLTLYFLEGRDELTPESKLELKKTLQEIGRRPVPDVLVVGHTDRVGRLEENDRLALRRAQRIKEDLIAIGIPGDSIQAIGRGEREPLVPTADEVPEARNRRVEVLVR